MIHIPFSTNFLTISYSIFLLISWLQYIPFSIFLLISEYQSHFSDYIKFHILTHFLVTSHPNFYSFPISISYSIFLLIFWLYHIPSFYSFPATPFSLFLLIFWMEHIPFFSAQILAVISQFYIISDPIFKIYFMAE